MRNILVLVLLILVPQLSTAGEILNEYSSVVTQPVFEDTINGSVHHMWPVQIYDGTTGQSTDWGVIDLDQFGFVGSQLVIFVTDWARDRVLFAETRQVWIPDYHVLDLRTRTIYRPESDILNQVFGDMYMSPNCRYIVCFGEDYDLINQTGQTSYLENHNIIFTVVIDAETFNLISRMDAFSARMGTFPPKYFFSGDTMVYIVNPFTGPKNRQLVRVSLPSLAIQDTIRFASFCDSLCQEVIIEDVRANLTLIHALYSSGDSTGSVFKVIDLISKTAISRLDVPLSPIYGVSRLSDDADYAAFQERQRYLIYDRNFRRHFEIEGAGDYSLPGAIFGRETISFYSEREDAILVYDLETGRERERRDRR